MVQKTAAPYKDVISYPVLKFSVYCRQVVFIAISYVSDIKVLRLLQKSCRFSPVSQSNRICRSFTNTNFLLARKIDLVSENVDKCSPDSHGTTASDVDYAKMTNRYIGDDN